MYTASTAYSRKKKKDFSKKNMTISSDAEPYSTIKGKNV